MNKMVSIIMPSYNTGKYISESINSVINQTYTDWELIIVDDASNDETDSIVSNYLKDKRIRYIKKNRNCGAALCRNAAISEAKGRWVAFLDSDDVWKSDKLEKQIKFMEENDYYFSYTNYSEIDENGNRTGVKVTGPKRITHLGMTRYCWPGCLTVIYDANYIGLVQIHDIRKNNDYAMWLLISKKADCYLLDEELALYRRGRNGSISNHRIATMIKWHYLLFSEAEEKKPLVASILTMRNLIFGFYKKIRYVSTIE